MKYILVEAYVRYWEDGYINNEQDNDLDPKMPCIENNNIWKIIIDIDTGKIENWPDNIVADIHYKVCDAGEYYILDENKQKIFKYYDHYVPKFLSIESKGYGDYIILKINNDGYINNWKFNFIEDEWNKI